MSDRTVRYRSNQTEFPDIAATLERIYEDCDKYRAEIRGMLMRTHPQRTWAAKAFGGNAPEGRQ